MKIGILSDIHESNDDLVNAIDLLGRRKVDLPGIMRVASRTRMLSGW